MTKKVITPRYLFTHSYSMNPTTELHAKFIQFSFHITQKHCSHSREHHSSLIYSSMQMRHLMPSPFSIRSNAVLIFENGTEWVINLSSSNSCIIIIINTQCHLMYHKDKPCIFLLSAVCVVLQLQIKFFFGNLCSPLMQTFTKQITEIKL